MEKPRNTLSFTLLVSVLSLACLTMMSCGDDDGNPEGPDGIVGVQPDTIAPGAVTDLRLRSPTARSVAVVWTAPGDDGTTGTAAEYDIRYSVSPVTGGNWDQAIPVDEKTVPEPQPGGRVETVVVTGLAAGIKYYFALKAADEVPNWSALSNCASGVTIGETIPPDDVTDLAAVAVDDTSYMLTWTTPGHRRITGTAAEYDIRYSTYPIANEQDWNAAFSVGQVPPPRPAGERDSVTVTGTDFQSTWFFALKTADELQNWSGISNNAAGLAFGETFWLHPKNVYRGEEVYILFRTSTTDVLTLTTNGLYVPYVCDRGVLEEITSGVFPDGVHLVTYDFFSENLGRYYSEGYYRIGLCRGTEVLGDDSVEFKY